jgi:aspartate/glutamate racemase
MDNRMSARIAILGGQSAMASAAFQYRLACRLHQSGARSAVDYPAILHWSLALENDASLEQALLSLSGANPTIIAAPCNSVTLAIDGLRDSGKLRCPTLTPVHALNRLILPGRNLVLGVANTSKQRLVKLSIGTTLYPNNDDQAWVDHLYVDIVEQGPTAALGLALSKQTEHWHSQGVTRVILACTEFSLLVPDSPITSTVQKGEAMRSWVDGMAELISLTVAATS